MKTWVYIIEDCGNHNIKIGTTANSSYARLGQIQHHHSDKLVLLDEYLFELDDWMSINYVVEAWVHVKLKRYNVRGEWFRHESLPIARCLLSKCCDSWARRKKPKVIPGLCRGCCNKPPITSCESKTWHLMAGGFCSSDCYCSYAKGRMDIQERLHSIVKEEKRKAKYLFTEYVSPYTKYLHGKQDMQSV